MACHGFWTAVKLAGYIVPRCPFVVVVLNLSSTENSLPYSQLSVNTDRHIQAEVAIAGGVLLLGVVVCRSVCQRAFVLLLPCLCHLCVYREMIIVRA